MKHSIPQRRSRHCPTQLTATAVGAALLIATFAAQAQDATQTVTVTGIRKGIEDAISVKRNADAIVEAISAEDIGKLPDNSIAESIARLPGLAAQRVAGRAQTVSIRGLSGDFAGTLLNGREQVSTGDNRAVEFDQYPSELLSGVTVYKTPDAGLIGQGLSGTLDMQTVRPLNFGKRTIALGARVDHNSLGKLNADSSPDGQRFNAAYIDQFADRTIGLALGYAHLDTRTQSQKWSAWGYPTDNGGVNALNGGVPTRVIGGSEAKTYSGKAVRDSAMAVVEFKPNKNFTSLVDVYHSNFTDKVVDRGLVTGLAWSGATPSNLTIKNNIVTGGTFTGVKPVVWNELQTRDDTIDSVGWNNKLKLSDGWRGEVDLSKSTAKRKERILEAYAGTQGVTDTFTFKTDPSTGRPVGQFGLSYSDPTIIKMLDSGGWGQDGYVKWLNVKDDLSAFKIMASKDLSGAITSVDAGLHYADRKKDKNVPEALLYLNASPTTVPASLALSPTSVAGQGANNAALAWDIQGALDQLYRVQTKNHRDIYNKQWSVSEKITTAFVKANIDSEVAGLPVRGNFGLQVVGTDQSSEAIGVDTSACVGGAGGSETCPTLATKGGKNYTDVLPSLNLAMSLSSDQTLRLAIGRQVARARLDQLRASTWYSFDLTKKVFSGDGGNPNLDPFRADALDISYEKYFGNKAYVGAAAFYKDLKSYIYKGPTTKDFTGFPTPPGVTPTSWTGNVTAPLNGKGGQISGLELSASMPLSMATPVLDGFGVVASYSYTDSKIKPQGPGTTMPLPGLSRDVANLTFYYEKSGFSARVGQRYRSEFVGEIQGFGADRALEFIAAERVTDLQLGYEFGNGALKGLSVLFQVNNLSNSPYKTYYDTPDKPKEYTQYGRTMLMGVSYKL